jgi:hypothetical protein
VAATPPGSRPLLRTGGIALLGIGVIAATVGLFTSATTQNGSGTAVPSASSQRLPATGASVAPLAPEPSAPAVAAPAPDAGTASAGAVAPAEPDGSAAARSAPPMAAAPAPPAPAPGPVAAPPVAVPPAGAGSGSGSGSAGGGTAAARAPLRVYNNSLIQGLAAKAKADFEAAGWTVTDISGYGQGVIPHSTVYFRPGTAEEAAAQELGREFGLRVEPRFPGIQQSSDGVIVIVTEDYKSTGKS